MSFTHCKETVRERVQKVVREGLDISEDKLDLQAQCSAYNGFQFLCMLATLEKEFNIDLDFDEVMSEGATLGEIINYIVDTISG